MPWCMSGSLTRFGRENVPGIPGACAAHNFTYLARGPWRLTDSSYVLLTYYGIGPNEKEQQIAPTVVALCVEFSWNKILWPLWDWHNGSVFLVHVGRSKSNTLILSVSIVFVDTVFYAISQVLNIHCPRIFYGKMIYSTSHEIPCQWRPYCYLQYITGWYHRKSSTHVSQTRD